MPVVRRGARLLYALLKWTRPRDTRTTKLRAILENHTSPLSSYAVLRQVMGPELRQALLGRSSPDLLPLPSESGRRLEETARELDSVNAHSFLELSLYMANMLLRDTDQMSMAHGLEVRDPLLDFNLVEEVARIPGPLKLAAGKTSRTKGLLVDALPVRLPPPVLRRTKMGFVFPWERWLRNELRPRIEATLSHGPTLEAVGMRPSQVGSLWDDYRHARPGLRYTDVLGLHNLLYWVRQHRLTLPPVASRSSPGCVPTPMGS
jgi:asparagine synthase (glutamine-hydrolysing)